MNFTITIAREYGSGGHIIAEKISEQLNIPLFDKDSLIEEAKKQGIDTKLISNFGGETSGFYFPSMNNTPSLDLELSQQSYMATLKMIQIIASEMSSVIVGRCADYILSDDPKSVLKVFVYAPLEDKVKRAIKAYGLPNSKAIARDIVLKNDKKRKKYYEFITEKDWKDPLEYDVMINSNIGLDAAADMIVEAAKRKFNLK